MPFARKSLADLRTQSQADFSAALAGSDPLLRFSVLGVLADVFAEIENGAYGYIDYVGKQAVPFTATDEWAEGWAALKGVTRKPASYATASAVSGLSTIGRPIPAGTQLVRSDGATYVTLSDVAVSGGGTATVSLQAVEAGSASNLTAGQNLVLGSPIAGVASTWTVGAAAAGADVEGDDDFRTRYLEVYRNPPQGGAAADYVEWALNVPGVTRAWVTPNGVGAGTVVVYSMLDQAEADFGGFPQGTDGVAAGETRGAAATGDQLLVANAIFPLRPVTALVYSKAPLANAINYTISLPGASVGTKALVAAAIVDVMLTFGTPGGVVVPDGETAGLIELSWVEGEIAKIPAAQGFVIQAVSCTHGSVGPTNGNVTCSVGYLPTLGAITWS
jgi:uncharacterized phage protein gp47/JayE